MNQVTTLCIVASHSGGHIIPALTLAAQAQHDDPPVKIVCITSDRILDKSIVAQSSLALTHLPLFIEYPPLRAFWRLPRWLYRTVHLAIQVWSGLKKNSVNRIISTGGLSAVPVCLIGKLLGIPYELYELNAAPGKATKLLARWATRTYCIFAKTVVQIPGSIQAPYPNRFVAKDRISRTKARALLGIPGDLPVLVVLGGSQGARGLNEVIMQEIVSLPNLFVMHQTGTQDYDRVQKWYTAHHKNAFVVPYSDTMHLLYSAADLIIARGGSGTIHEIIWFGTPALIVPLEAPAVDPSLHQVHNASAAAAAYPGLIQMVRQTEISILRRALRELAQ